MRALLLLGAVGLLYASAPGASAQSAGPDEGSQGLSFACEFRSIQNGQFNGARYETGPTGGKLGFRFVASAADRLAGRAVMIGENSAVVVALVVQPSQLVFVETGEAGRVSVTSLFTADRSGASIAAAHSRHVTIGKVPLVSQYQGLCTPK